MLDTTGSPSKSNSSSSLDNSITLSSSEAFSSATGSSSATNSSSVFSATGSSSTTNSSSVFSTTGSSSAIVLLSISSSETNSSSKSSSNSSTAVASLGSSVLSIGIITGLTLVSLIPFLEASSSVLLISGFFSSFAGSVSTSVLLFLSNLITFSNGTTFASSIIIGRSPVEVCDKTSSIAFLT